MTAHSGAAAHPIPAGLGREQLLELYYYMRLTRSLEERLTRVRQALDARATPHAGVPMDPELEERLRSLGYVGGGSER